MADNDSDAATPAAVSANARQRRGRSRKQQASSSSSSDSSSSDSSSSSSSSDSDSDSEIEEKEHKAPITDARELVVDMVAINPSLTCALCNGYYRDAHTIMDCLHIFCRQCLIRHIARTRRNDVVACPTRGCTTRLISTDPMKTEVRFDRNMQNIVDKIMPQFAKKEDEIKEKLYAQHGRGRRANGKRAGGEGGAAEADGVTKKPKIGDEKFGMERLMIFELRPSDPAPITSTAPSSPTQPLPPLPQPFIKTSAKVTVRVLRKFIADRLGLESIGSPGANQIVPVEVQCGGEVLGQDHSIEYIWRTRWQHLHPNQHLVLTYRWQAHHI